MTIHTLPLVGAHFRPPAKAILQVLPGATPLLLRPEPDNAYDPNAIQVLVKTSELPEEAHDDLELHAQGYGHSLEEILAEPEWHLGYVKATEAVWLVKQLSGDTSCKLGSLLNGNPAVIVETSDE